MTTTISITADMLVVEPVGLDKLWSFTRRLRVPLDQVRGATYDPGMRRMPKGWRGPGLRLGDKLCGTFHAEGGRQFWNVSGYENAVVVQLASTDDTRGYERLVLSVTDPKATTDAINAALR